MSSQQSFGRVVNLKVFATSVDYSNGLIQPTIVYNNGYTLFSSVQPDGSPGYRIRGSGNKIESTVGIIPNPFTVFIYNLGPTSRALIQQKLGTKLVVEAGYQGNVRQIFIGSIIWAATYKEGASDYVTEIQAKDGGFALVNGAVNKSFKGAVSYQQVIDFLVGALADVGVGAGTITGIPSGGYNNGIVFTASPLEELKKVCTKLGLSCSVQNTNVVIVPLGQAKPAPPILISPENGLIGIPELRTQALSAAVGAASGSTPANLISFKCLLRSELDLYSKVTIQSKFIRGDYTIARVNHDFDSWEGPFFTHCECANS